jgi:hypothetical protein
MKLISFTVVNNETNDEIPSTIFMELTDTDFSNLVENWSDYDGSVMDFYIEAFTLSLGIWNSDILVIDDETYCVGPVFEHTTHTFYNFGK